MKYAQNFQAQRETVFPFQNPRQRVDAVKNNSSDNAEVFPPEISTLDGMQLNKQFRVLSIFRTVTAGAKLRL